ncbi:MAG: metallophosphoesterase, partial [Acidobacteria bacterium]|nr:metallophosphoesterase [Acidobacteriota bacterium]
MYVSIPPSIAATFALRAGVVFAHVWLAWELRGLFQRRGVRWPWLWAVVLVAPAFALLLSGGLFEKAMRLAGLDVDAPHLWQLCSAMWTIGLGGAFGVEMLRRGWRAWRKRRTSAVAPAIEPELTRTGLITRRAALAAPFAVSGYGVFIERERFRLTEVEMAVPDLPRDLDGLRIGQITDIHAGPFLAPREIERVVAMVNEAKPHLTVVTGDLVTGPGDPLHETIDVLAGLRADSGLWGCMGNHEKYARCLGEAQVYGRAKGIEFLRQSNRTLQFGDARLNLVGVDYQRTSQPYLDGAEQWLEPGAVNLLLSHNPDVFPVAAELGYDLILSGHTHGGQITLEIVDQTVNPGRFMTPYVSGLY